MGEFERPVPSRKNEQKPNCQSLQGILVEDTSAYRKDSQSRNQHKQLGYSWYKECKAVSGPFLQRGRGMGGL